jgi:hypothetical protein
VYSFAWRKAEKFPGRASAAPSYTIRGVVCSRAQAT